MSTPLNYNLLYEENHRKELLRGILIFLSAAFFLLPFVLVQGDFKITLFLLLGLGITFLSLRRLDIGIGLLFLTAPVIMIGERSVSDQKLVFAAFLLALWGIKKMYYREDCSAMLRHPFSVFVAMFSVLSFISVLGSSEFNTSLKYWIKYLGNLAFFFVFLDLFKSEKQLRMMIGMLLAGAVLEALYGILEFLVSYQEVFPLLYRSKGTFYHPNIYARFLSVVLVFLTALVVGEKGKSIRFFYAACGAVLLVGLAASSSRSAVLSLLVCSLFIFSDFYRWRLRKLFLILPIALFLLLNLGMVKTIWNVTHYAKEDRAMEFEDELRITNESSFFGALLSQRLFKAVSREKIWEGSFKMFLSKPWTGVGVGAIADVSADYAEMTYWDLQYLLDQYEKQGFIFPHLIVNSHNVFLHIAVEMGVGGIFLFLGMYGLIFANAKKAIPLLRGHSNKKYLLGGTAAVMNDLLIGATEPANLFGPGSLGFLFIFFTAVIFMAPHMEVS